jgi:hypothetical protein
MKRPPMVMDKYKYYYYGHTTKNDTQIQCNPHISHSSWKLKKILKFKWKYKRPK